MNALNDFPIPVLGFAAYSGTGKTTLLEALLPRLKQRGIRVGMLKHAHHDFDIDIPGKDSYRLRKAGADQMLVTSHQRFAMVTETPEQEPSFEYLLSRFNTQELDLILVEGCKNIIFPKMELHRQALNKPWLFPQDASVIGIVADSTPETTLPCLDINDLDAVADFVQAFIQQSKINK
nr:molybdopterin-guanine dinucleotide biosynthesis protein B [Vibrio gangliei]